MAIKKVGVFCGAKWYRASDWQLYPAFKHYQEGGFSIGPFLFWDGK